MKRPTLMVHSGPVKSRDEAPTGVREFSLGKHAWELHPCGDEHGAEWTWRRVGLLGQMWTLESAHGTDRKSVV